MKINIKKLTDTAIIPTKGSEKSAGFDLCADIDEAIAIPPHETRKVGTGLAITPPNNTFGAIVARSGLATKRGLAPSNKFGVCDFDYTGEYIIALHNHSNKIQTIEPHERIAQLIFIPYITGELQLVDELEETERGSGGFGSTGK